MVGRIHARRERFGNTNETGGMQSASIVGIFGGPITKADIVDEDEEPHNRCRCRMTGRDDTHQIADDN